MKNNHQGKTVWPKGKRLFSSAVILAIFCFINIAGAAQVQPVSGFSTAKQQGGTSITKIVKVKSTTRYKIGQDKEIKAVFEGLKPEALELGLNNAVLFGKPITTESAGGKLRVKIDWHTISAQAAKTASLSEKLKPALKSQFLVMKDDKNVEPGTIIPAKGNFESLTETFLALQDRINKKEAIEIASAESSDDEDSGSRELSSSSNDSDFSSGSNSSEISEADSATASDSYETNLITTTWEDCYPRVSELEEKLYLQHQEIQTNSDGTINSTGECLDTGQTITASRLWGETDSGCANIVDYTSNLVYFQYKAVAQYNEQEIIVRDCFNDQSQSTAIQTTTANCGFRHDFTTGVSIQQEELYYAMGADQFFLSNCQDGPNSYAHFETSSTCEMILDTTNNLYFPATRIAFTLDDGTLGFATECTAGNTTWEDCPPRVADLEEKLYLQHREIITDIDGSITSTGECIDTGETIDATRLWGETDSGCPNIYDFAAGRAYFQYKAVAQFEAQEIVVRDCTNDQTQYAAILSTIENCTFRHDFNDGYSVQQEELFYMEGTTRNFITLCQDQATTYAHFETTATCTPITDYVENLFYPLSRVAYTLNDGTVDYATDCRILETAGLPITEAFCDPKYEHDYTAGTSYYITQDIYTDTNGVAQPLTECSRSGTASFAHQNDLTTCPIVNDDVNLQTTIYGTLYIDTPDDGIIELEPCHQIGIPLAYVRVDDYAETEFTASATWTIPAGVNTAYVNLVGAGQRGENGTAGGGAVTTADSGTIGGSGGRGGRGGAAGEVKENVMISVVGQTSISVTIGTASGSNSSFGTLLTATGGSGYGSTAGTGGVPYASGGLAVCGNANGTSGTSGTNNYHTGSPGAGGYLGTYVVNSLICQQGGGAGGGGGGASGYGTAFLSGHGTVGSTSTVVNTLYYPGNPGWPGGGGYGYGAGGGGAGGGGGAPAKTASPGYGGLGGANAPGYAKIGFTATSYVRGDGTIYYLP